MAQTDITFDDPTIDTSTEKRFRTLMAEFRPTMGHDILLAWANDVIEAWQGDAPQRAGAGDFADRQFYQGFGFCLAHIARDMGDDHSAKMFGDQNQIGISEFLRCDLDPYDLNPLKVAFAEDLPVEEWNEISEWDRTSRVLFGYQDPEDGWTVRFSDDGDLKNDADVPVFVFEEHATHFLIA